MGKRKENQPDMLRLMPGGLGYITKGRHRTAETGLKRLGVFRAALGVFIFVVLAVGAYFAATTYIFPGIQTAQPATPLPQPEEESQPVEEESSLAPVRYHEKSGLPVYDDADVIFIVNSRNPLSEEYQTDLTEVAGIQVDAMLREALFAMMEKAQAEGVTLTYAGGYVDAETQQALYDEKVQALIQEEKSTAIMARARAESFVPKPGESDTQTGLCVTLQGERDTFTASAEYSWLSKYAVDYGFVFRYPEGKTEYTRMEPDLRVLRYVGNDSAVKMRQLSMCLEEYAHSLGL